MRLDVMTFLPALITSLERPEVGSWRISVTPWVLNILVNNFIPTYTLPNKKVKPQTSELNYSECIMRTGTAVFWVAMITNPHLNSKIEVMMALAPAASVANVKSFVRLSAAFVDPIEVQNYEPKFNRNLLYLLSLSYFPSSS